MQWLSKKLKNGLFANCLVVTVKPRIGRDKTMADKLMYIPNDDKQNYPFCRLQLVVVML